MTDSSPSISHDAVDSLHNTAGLHGGNKATSAEKDLHARKARGIDQSRSPLYPYAAFPEHFEWSPKDVIYKVHWAGNDPFNTSGYQIQGQFSELTPFQLQVDPAFQNYDPYQPPAPNVEKKDTPIFEVITTIYGYVKPANLRQPHTDANPIDELPKSPNTETSGANAKIELQKVLQQARTKWSMEPEESSNTEQLADPIERPQMLKPQAVASQLTQPLVSQPPGYNSQMMYSAGSYASSMYPQPQHTNVPMYNVPGPIYPPASALAPRTSYPQMGTLAPQAGIPAPNVPPTSYPPSGLYNAPGAPQHTGLFNQALPEEPKVYYYPGEPTMKLGDLSITHVKETRIKIFSKILLDEINDFEYNKQWFHEGSEIIEPYHLLLYNVARIERLAQAPDSSENETTTKDEAHASFTARSEKARQFRCLLHFLEPVIKTKLRPAEEGFKRQIPVISHSNLWYIYRPGTKVYFESESFPGMFCQGLVTISESSSVSLMGIAFDGSVWGKTYFVKALPYFEGEQEVASLRTCPEEHWEARHGRKREQELIKKGKMYYKLAREGHREMFYDGPIFDSAGKKRFYRGNVVVDILAATTLDSFHTRESKQELAQFGFTVFKFSKPELDKFLSPDPFIVQKLESFSFTQIDNTPEPDFKTVESLSDATYTLLSHKMAGYAVKEKKWMAILTDHLSEIERVPDPLAGVVIDPIDIQMIKALSFRQRTAEVAWAADFVKGKGVGQIVLLHGPPGVGKTYTVECIAESFERPLLALTIANVGTTEENMETELDRWFSMAERWDAVLLIDEADVFLERRSKSDLDRNALVAIFLRKMEYFKGLLFLTTNRVAQIDDAFASRVHVIIGYEPLNDEGRQKIWKNFFQKLLLEKKGKLRVGPEAQKYVFENKDIQKRQWNGREIRNALQTAIAMAEYDASLDEDRGPDEPIILQPRHFNSVMKMSRAFQKYMFAVSKEDESKRAFSRRDRADFFTKHEGSKIDDHEAF